MYGHIRTMALEVKKGLEAAGSKVTLLRVAETLPDEVLTKMGAPGVGKDDEVATAASLADYDGLMFGIPTRFGMAPAQVKALMDSTGGLWQKGAVRLRRPRTQSKQRAPSYQAASHHARRHGTCLEHAWHSGRRCATRCSLTYIELSIDVRSPVWCHSP